MALVLSYTYDYTTNDFSKKERKKERKKGMSLKSVNKDSVNAEYTICKGA
jgi:hypothetical protein